jgi:hypothetical protein
MGESLVFIMERFYYSLGSGCLINIYVLLMLWVLARVELLPDLLGKLLIKYEGSSNAIWIFMFFALIIGMFIEGSTHIFTQYFQKHRDEERNFLISIIKIILKPGVRGACKDYWKEQPEVEPKSQYHYFKFMYDPVTHKRYNKDDIYPVMRATALRISQKAGNNVSRFKELSYILQGMRFSCILIFLFSFLAMLCVAIIWVVSGYGSSWMKIGVFYLVCCAIFALLVKLTGSIALGFSKRYVRKIGEWYNALGLHNKTAETEKASVSGA